MTKLMEFNLYKMVQNPKKLLKFILFLIYLLILALNSTLIFTGGEWIIINILAIISISFSLWYVT